MSDQRMDDWRPMCRRLERATGRHTIEPRPLGTKDSRSSGTRVDLDVFRYLR